MVVLKNTSYDWFIEESGDKDIVIFGAGQLLDVFLKNHILSGNVLLLNRIIAVLDNDIKKNGQNINICKKNITVETFESFRLKHGCFDNCTFILMLMHNHILLDVVNQLDKIDELDGVICYYGLGTLNWSNEVYPTLPVNPLLPQPSRNYKIPKVIHYCWFGESYISDSATRCIESWRLYCPDYEIKLWNEDNYDISKAPVYVQQAYKANMYAYVSDYARLDIVYRNGGLYFDVDVEIIRNIDNLLKYKAFFGFLTWSTINTGLGFGSIANNKAISDMMQVYELFDFELPDGSYYKVDCPRFANEYFRRNGVTVNNTLQIVDDMLFLPNSFMSPLDAVIGSDGKPYLALYALQENTISIHKCDSSWFDEVSSNEINMIKKEHIAINNRLYADWKRCVRHE